MSLKKIKKKKRKRNRMNPKELVRTVSRQFPNSPNGD